MAELFRFLLRWLRRLVGVTAPGPGRGPAAAYWRAEEERRAEEEAQRGNAGSVVRQGGYLSHRVSEDGVAYRYDTFDYQTPDGVHRQHTIREVRRCDCGAFLSQDNDVVGVCSVQRCQATVCGRCADVCARCGLTVCRRHSKRLGGEVYCGRCWLGQAALKLGGLK